MRYFVSILQQQQKGNKMMNSFVFVRHGRTDWSMAVLTKGPGDLSLNELGRADAYSAGEVLCSFREKEFSILSSELVRARQTAAIISEMIGTSVLVFPNLHERYFGDFSVTSSSEIPADAESESDFQKRVAKVFSEISTKADFFTKTVVVVSHSLVFKQLSLLLTGQKKTINYGEAYLFSKREMDDVWQLDKLVCEAKK